MIYFRQLENNTFELDKESLKTLFTPNDVIARIEKSDDINFYTSDIRKGINFKFWMKSSSVPEGMLFKISKYRKSNDQYEEEPRATFHGELIIDMICYYTGLDHTSYYPCIIQMMDGTTLQGSLSTNYKQDIYDVEYSAENINTRYCQSQYDNNDGFIPHIETNTVYEYMKQLKSLYKDRFDKEKIDSMKNYFLKVALLDFVTLQIDRHWGNFGFMANHSLGIKTLVPIPIFDNECCFCLDEPISKIQGYSCIIDTIRNSQSKFIKPLATGKASAPLLGVKTSLVVNDKGNRIISKKPEKGELTNIETFMKEMVQEISENKDVREFYNKLKNFDLELYMNKTGYFPDYVVNLAPKLYKQRLSMLENELKQKQGKCEYE